ncbi:quinone oxidoreductase [Apiospora kogelbergensis]|uniref:quinone oxidoreductase n=1 Tax=Apiospora kogelbergensis TaxID=1337665 RepID=UPI00312D273B
MSPIPPLPSHHRALTLKSTEVGLELTTVPTPVPSHGTVLVHVEAASVLSYHREIFNGARKYPLPSSTKDGAGFAGGYSAVGRVASVGPDATLLKPGQLVFADCVIHARDDPAGVFYLVGVATGSTDGGRYLANHVWRDGAFAEYVALPLENCVPLDESRLCSAPSAGGLGYSVADLAYASYLLVAYGGLRDIGLEPGETLIVCPATGGFGGAGVMTAVAMGARVIAMGRNATELARLQDRVATTYTAGNSHVETVRITGNMEADAQSLREAARGATVDAVLDFTPPQAAGEFDTPTERDTSIASWRTRKVMYEREDMVLFFKLLEAGLFPRGGGLDGGNENNFAHTKAFGLHQSQEALDAAAEHTGIGRSVVFAPEGMD